MVIRTVLIVFSVHLILAAASLAQTAGPGAAVKDFYAFDQKASQVFNRRNLDARRRWMSPRLYELFRAELRKQKAQLKVSPDEKPYFGDGFPFRPIDEPCETNGRSFRRRYSIESGDRASRGRTEVPVRFFYPKPCTIDPVVFKAIVVRAGAKWLIDDIIYDDGSRLSESMKNRRN